MEQNQEWDSPGTKDSLVKLPSVATVPTVWLCLYLHCISYRGLNHFPELLVGERVRLGLSEEDEASGHARGEDPWWGGPQ